MASGRFMLSGRLRLHTRFLSSIFLQGRLKNVRVYGILMHNRIFSDAAQQTSEEQLK